MLLILIGKGRFLPSLKMSTIRPETDQTIYQIPKPIYDKIRLLLFFILQLKRYNGHGL